jgi:hypothetical protein
VNGFSPLVPRAVLVLIATIAFFHGLPGQQRSPSNHLIISVVGTVKGISGNTIVVDSGAKVTAVIADKRTEIWKGKTFHNLSPIQIGDDFSARCRADASGKLVAGVIWLNIVNFFGVITKVDGDGFEMLTNPNADPQSAYVKKKLKVSVDADTLFDASAKEDLKPGRDVQMVGLDLKDGNIRATRLTVLRAWGAGADGKREGVAAGRTTEIEVSLSRWSLTAAAMMV